MKNILMSIRLYYFYCTCKGIKTKEIRKKFPLNYKGKIYEYVSKTNWRQDLMKIPAEEREFFKQFVGKVGLCFECDKVERLYEYQVDGYGSEYEIASDTLKQEELLKECCLTYDQLSDYLDDINNGYAIHINDLEIFDKPKDISEFKSYKKNIVSTKIGSETFEVELDNSLSRAPQSYCFIEI